MEQSQMNRYTFSLNLEGVSLPDAISALVEAWYDSQVIEVDGKEQKEAIGLRGLKPSDGESKRATWKQCAWYVRPMTYSKLKRYVNRLQENGQNADASDVVDCALQMWMDDFV
jgi:hypothetical protein